MCWLKLFLKLILSKLKFFAEATSVFDSFGNLVSHEGNLFNVCPCFTNGLLFVPLHYEFVRPWTFERRRSTVVSLRIPDYARIFYYVAVSVAIYSHDHRDFPLLYLISSLTRFPDVVECLWLSLVFYTIPFLCFFSFVFANWAKEIEQVEYLVHVRPTSQYCFNCFFTVPSLRRYSKWERYDVSHHDML